MNERQKEREDQVLTALRNAPSPLSRSALAKALGRKQLNVLDIQALSILEERGEITVERLIDPRPAGFRTLYSAKETSNANR